jgi:hypothetical protein
MPDDQRYRTREAEVPIGSHRTHEPIHALSMEGIESAARKTGVCAVVPKNEVWKLLTNSASVMRNGFADRSSRIRRGHMMGC